MVLPIGFFMPLPLAMMIPFMGIQSAVMAKQFGENFQYGKRRISAMSNEEFNKLTPTKLQLNANAELKAMIPAMEDSVKEMRTFQTFLIGEFLKMLNDAIGKGLGTLFGFDDPFNRENPVEKTPTPVIDKPRSKQNINPPVPEKKIPAFIPPKFTIGETKTASASLAIARVIKQQNSRTRITSYTLQSQLTKGRWTTIKSGMKKRLEATTLAAQAYPSPGYYPSYRGDSVYYFRVK